MTAKGGSCPTFAPQTALGVLGQIAGSLFSDVRMRDQEIVSATLAEPEYVALVAVTKATRP